MLATGLWVGLSGCAASNPDAPLQSRYKVTARVVDIPRDAAPAARTDQRPAVETLRRKPPSASPLDRTGAALPPAPALPEASLPERNADRLDPAESRPRPEPEPNPEEQFLLRVAAERPVVPLDGSVNGERATAGFVGGDQQCSRLGISYPERRVSEIWRVCANRQFELERKAEPTPPVPDDPGLEPARRMAVHSAYSEGTSSVPFGPFTISAQTGGPPDERGCMLIRSALTWRGIPVATRDETICSPPAE